MKYNFSIQKTSQTKIDSVDFGNLPFGKIFTDHMFVMDYADGQWQQGRIEPFGHIPIHPACTALHYGQAIFEGMKAQKDEYGNALLFRPYLNAARLNLSAARMAMPAIPEDLYVAALEALVGIDRNWIPEEEDTSLYIRPFMFSNDEYVGIKPADHYKFVIFCCPVGPYYATPVKVYVTDKYVRAFPRGTGMAKAAGNYGATLMPVQEVQQFGYHQILWLDGIEKKYIQEVGTMNVFIQIGDEFITPSLQDETILDGVTRRCVMDLLKDKNYKVTERNISIQELIEAHQNGLLKDMFGAGTAATISTIAEFGYEGKEYKLPIPNNETISIRVKKELQDIKSGRIADRFGWVVKVPEFATI